MRENDNMPYAWWKKKIESQGFYKIEETANEIIVKNDDACITFNKQSWNYTATGFGGQLAFTTYPIYDDWKILITAWLNEHRRTGWVEQGKEE